LLTSICFSCYFGMATPGQPSVSLDGTFLPPRILIILDSAPFKLLLPRGSFSRFFVGPCAGFVFLFRTRLPERSWPFSLFSCDFSVCPVPLEKPFVSKMSRSPLVPFLIPFLCMICGGQSPKDFESRVYVPLLPPRSGIAFSVQDLLPEECE